jgi:hypothetical protein
MDRRNLDLVQPPKWCDTPRLRYCWKHPWTRVARRNRRFRKRLLRHGYLTPHFKLKDAKCHDGTAVPDSLRRAAQRHAFHLERFRHAIGGKALPVLSWYRTPSYNRAIGGASASKHMEAIATDFSRELIDSIGRSLFFRTADLVFANGGVGTYPSGSGHLDSRGYRARWTSF